MSKKKEIGDYMSRKMLFFKETSDYASTKAELAKLRRGIGHEPGELPELYGSVLKNMPDNFWNGDGIITKAEWSCYSALILYAWHQQGNDANTHGMHTMNRRSVGDAMRLLVHKSNDSNAEERMVKKLQMLLISNDMNEFVCHLKNIVSLLRRSQIALNYVELATDVYSFQFEESKNKVCLKWGQDFYRENKEDEDNE